MKKRQWACKRSKLVQMSISYKTDMAWDGETNGRGRDLVERMEQTINRGRKRERRMIRRCGPIVISLRVISNHRDLAKKIVFACYAPIVDNI